MKLKTILVPAFCALATPLTAYAQSDDVDDVNWRVSLAAGTIITPTFLGDNSYQFSGFPNLTVEYKDKFRASFEGLSYTLFDAHGFSVGPVAKFNFGRDEDGSNPLGIGGDTDDLIGLGDVDFTVEVGGFVQYSFEQFSAKVEVRQAVSGHDGLVGDLELKYSDTFDAFGKSVYYSLGPEFSYGDDSFNSAFFDVSAAQSAASGLSTFDANGGINSFGFHASVVVPVTDKISVIGFGGYDRLVGDIADSSLVQERGSENQGLFGILINYQFR